MPPVVVRYYREADGSMPVRVWLRELKRVNGRAFAKCMVRVGRLALLGHELRRPEADLLRDGIYELRVRDGSVNIRVLYFFHGREVTVLAHAITKEDRVPPIEIERALRRKAAFEQAPAAHLGTEVSGE